MRAEVLTLLEEGAAQGARLGACCRGLGVSLRSLQRWKHGTSDRRRGPIRPTAHRLSDAEKDDIVRLANTPQCRNLSPEQVVAKLADDGIYVCSERSLRRVLAERRLDRHRLHSKPSAGRRKPRSYVATEPLRLLSWDITYMKSAAVRGAYFYLYLFVDVWSRRIVAAEVHELQSAEIAAALLTRSCAENAIDAEKLVVHSDNGAPMKGSTMLATMHDLGITPSFSRPGVSDDNAFVEALFRHLKYAPSYPRQGFESLVAARAWATRFVDWYNSEHLHSAIGFVTPDDRHHGRDIAILEQRRQVYLAAQERNPRRWTQQTRGWERPAKVALNPERVVAVAPKMSAA